MERRFIRLEVVEPYVENRAGMPDVDETMNRLLAEGWRVETLTTGPTTELFPYERGDTRFRDAEGRCYRNWILAVLVRD